MTKLSDYVMSFLVDKGIRNVFMLPGGGAMHLDDSLGRCQELDFTCFLHEQAIAIAAEAYAQYTNTPGVALVTSGPGSTNTVTGVTAAYFDSTPVLFISGQAKSPDLKADSGVRQMGSQEVDIPSVVAPITKYAVTVLNPQKIRYHLEKAWYLATSGRMGPVWVDIPLDIQAALIDETDLVGFTPEVKAGKDIAASVDKVVGLLNAAKRPLVLAGNGIKLADSEDDFISFIEKNNIPSLLTWKTIDFLDYEHELNFGSPGIMGCRTANFLVQNCDLLLIIGSRLEPSVTAFDSEKFGKNATKVMVDIDEHEIRKVKGVDLALNLDAGEFLAALNEKQDEVNLPDLSDWVTYAQGLKVKYPVLQPEYYNSDAVNLYVFTDVLCQHLKEDDIITPESSGAAGEVTYQAMKLKKGQKVKNAAGLGSMGFGLPYSIGAAIAYTGRRTILINGDGAFQMNIQELETLTRLKLPVKMFILDNNGYGSIVATQDNMFGGPHVGSDPESGLTLPSLEKIAGAYGIRYAEVNCNDDLDCVIKDVLAGPDAVICRIVVEKKHVTMPKVQAMKLPDGGMVSKPLEDMFPYLSKEELQDNMIAGEKVMVKIVLLDIDGVITDGKVTVDADGKEFKTFAMHDVDAVFEMKRRGYKVGLITGEATPITTYFQRRLKPEYFYNGCKDKAKALDEIIKLTGVSAEEICYVGDGKYDIPALEMVGMSACPANAIKQVKEVAGVQLAKNGGDGALWELLGLLEEWGRGDG